MGKGQGPALVAQILLILCVVSDGSLLANGQETRTLQKVTTHNLLLLIKRIMCSYTSSFEVKKQELNPRRRVEPCRIANDIMQKNGFTRTGRAAKEAVMI